MASKKQIVVNASSVNHQHLTIADSAEFTWDFGCRFLLETKHGNYVWYSPNYGGDNTIHPWYGNPLNFTEPGFCGRSKGRHVIGDYCGNNVYIHQRDT
jgi:hypothetical protein